MSNAFISSDKNFEAEKSEYLEHYGVKGMKWGVRRTPEQLGYKKMPRHTGKKKPTKQQRIRADRVKAYENRRLLSDDELRARITRLELEKRFRELSDQDLHHGREVVKDILGVAGSQTAKTVTAGTMLYAAKVGMTRNFSWREAADYIAPKPKKK